MPKKQDTIIQTINLTKVYPGVVKTVALKDINLGIKRQGITAIIGQSGSGKSTLLNLLGTLDNITSGEIIIDGREVSKMTPEERTLFRNKTIGFVFQSHYLLPEFSVLENVLMPSVIRSGATPEARERAEHLLETVGIAEQKDKMATAISGGQKQRTAIARALMNNPQIVLADEPTGNLDSETSKVILDLFEKIHKEQKTTFVIITHDDRVAARASTIVELKDGEVIKETKRN